VIDFDDINSNDSDDEPRQPGAIAKAGLVVSEKAPTGQALHAEEGCYLETAKLPFVLFMEEDDDGREVFGNASEFQDAMDLIRPPTEQEAIAWSNDRLGAAFEKWRDWIDAAWLEAESRPKGRNR
jgi:hypothetical protein